MIEHVILAGLAGWRISSLLNWEPGPFDVFGKVRSAAGIRPGEITGELAKLIVCPWCLTVWTAAAMLAAGAFLSWWIPGLFAAMAVAMMAERWSTIASAIDRQAK
jgi:hypothetical protein